MSELAGGPAAKAGDTYEALWGVNAMLDLLDGAAIRIRIEPPHSDGEEFWIDRLDGSREHWQVKRQITGQSWTLNALWSNGVLAAFLPWLRANEKCVFASISDAPELRTLSRRARNALDLASFKAEQIREARWSKEFKNLLGYWDGVPEDEAFLLLKNVEVRSADDFTLVTDITRFLHVFFDATPFVTLALLRVLYVDSVHRTLNREEIYKYFSDLRVGARHIALDSGTRAQLRAITTTYIQGQRSKLVGRKLIHRTATDEVVARVVNASRAASILITGTAGAGKSGCLLEIVERLVAANIPVLAFRLDRLNPVQTAAALGREMELPESPALVFAQAFPNQKIAIVVDQLDFVSTTSGRHPDFFDTVAALFSEIRGLRGKSEVHLIAACRQFDFQHDSRLRALVEKDESPVSLDEFTEAEVRDTITTEGGQPNTLSAAQLKLLRLPQNLSLFVEAGLPTKAASSFVTQTELFTLYWREKHSALSNAWPTEAKDWQPILYKLVEEMNASEKLSAPRQVLDEFSSHFVDVMVSAGVLTFDGKVVGFGHESFFDYCFARRFATGSRELSDFLEGDEQHLFRRAQTRQVLVFLRESSGPRFIKNVRALLGSPKIRFHLKLLVLELIASFPDSSRIEWDVFRPLVESELEFIGAKKSNPEKLATRAYEIFRASRGMFHVADTLGVIEGWLNSGKTWLEEETVYYLSWQSHQHSERVAEILEQFVGKGGLWSERLRRVMSGRDIHKSRRFFDLFLRLMDDGTLDQSSDDRRYDNTVWSMVHGLAEEQPAWCAELAGRWLKREVETAVADCEEGQIPYVGLYDHHADRQVVEAATRAPDAFVAFVLREVLNAAEATKYPREGRFPADGIWQFRMYSDTDSLASAYLRACITSLASISKTDPKAFAAAMVDVRTSLTDTANYILLNVYLNSDESLADEAIRLLSDEPDRLRCGYSGNRYWVSMCLLEKFSPLCAPETFAILERVLANYAEPEEERREMAVFSLLSKLAPARTSETTQKLLSELSDKNVPGYGRPTGTMRCELISPIEPEVAAAMTDSEWTAAIGNHTSLSRRHWTEDGDMIGGAEDVASLLEKSAKAEPERFAKLALDFDEAVPDCYFRHILYALRTAEGLPDLKVAVARKVFKSDESSLLIAALHVLATTGDIALPDDALDFVRRAATHPDPKEDRMRAYVEDTIEYFSGDLFSCGINSVRGCAAETIHDLIRADAVYIEKFMPTVANLVADELLSVRACAAAVVYAIAARDVTLAFQLFEKLTDTNDVLRATPHVSHFIQASLQKHFSAVVPHIEVMLASDSAEVRQIGARVAAIAEMIHPQDEKARQLATSVLAGDYAQRLGAAEIAENHIKFPDWRAWCERVLKISFADENPEVRKKAAHCFWHLWQRSTLPLTEYSELIAAFQKSDAFIEEPSYLLHALGDSRQQLPEVVLEVCASFVEGTAGKNPTERRMSRGEHEVSELVFRAYQQLAGTDAQIQALNLIDRLCEEGIYSASSDLRLFER